MEKDNEMLILKGDVVEDFFYHENDKIAVLNNKLFKKVPEDVIIFAKLVIDDQGDEVIEPIEDSEYEKILKTYKLLLKAFNGQGGNND